MKTKPTMTVVGSKKKEPKIPERILREWATIATTVTSNQQKAEEACLTKVLRAYLGRGLSDDDFRDSTRITDPNYKDRYVLAHKDVKLGMIVHHFEFVDNTSHFSCSFEAGMDF